MKKNRWVLRLFVLVLTAAALNVTFSVAAEAGSAGDPLVTLSYLNTTYFKTILSEVDSKITSRNTELSAKLAGSDQTTSSTFQAITLAQGKTLTGDAGSEVMLRGGTAVCKASSAPGLVDETSGSSINNGTSLIRNHLYVMTTAKRSICASSKSVVLVRGTYSVT